MSNHSVRGLRQLASQPSFVIANPAKWGEAIQGGLRTLWIAARPSAARDDEGQVKVRFMQSHFIRKAAL